MTGSITGTETFANRNGGTIWEGTHVVAHVSGTSASAASTVTAGFRAFFDRSESWGDSPPSRILIHDLCW
jgi:hypothetical protein